MVHQSFMNKTVEEKSITFEIGKYAASWLGAFSRDRVRYESQDRVEFLDRLHSLSTDILERKIVEDSYKATFTYKVPSTWFQHLKLEKSPKWFKSKYPVKYSNKTAHRRVDITRKATYPMADVVVPENMGQVVIRDIVSPLNFYEDD